jgi:DNA topoisomerase-1
MPRLRRSNTRAPGLSRVRSGRSFRYLGIDAKPASAEERLRIQQLVIPPAWSDVWIAPHANGHVQATGVDAAGRTQYLYHPGWRAARDRVKFDRALELAASLPAARRRVTADLRSSQPTRDRALAAGFRMLDTGSLRVGSERYASQHGSRGLCTLLCEHVTVSGDTVRLSFPGKSQKAWESDIRDADLAAALRSAKRRGADEPLLAWRDDDRWRSVVAEEINDYVRLRTGGDFTAKDFRTLHGTIIAAVTLAKAGERSSATAQRKVVADAIREVAAALGNTVAVARSSYVDPRVITHYERGITIDPTGSPEKQLRELLG